MSSKNGWMITLMVVELEVAKIPSLRCNFRNYALLSTIVFLRRKSSVRRENLIFGYRIGFCWNIAKITLSIHPNDLYALLLTGGGTRVIDGGQRSRWFPSDYDYQREKTIVSADRPVACNSRGSHVIYAHEDSQSGGKQLCPATWVPDCFPSNKVEAIQEEGTLDNVSNGQRAGRLGCGTRWRLHFPKLMNFALWEMIWEQWCKFLSIFSQTKWTESRTGVF